MSQEILSAERANPDEIYEDTVIEYVRAEALRLEEAEREATEETYIALGHKITAAMLEREGATKYNDGSFDIRSSSTFETGEFELLPDLLQRVPAAAQAAFEAVSEDKVGLDTTETNEGILNDLLDFTAQFEEIIEEEISKEMEENHG